MRYLRPLTSWLRTSRKPSRRSCVHSSCESRRRASASARLFARCRRRIQPRNMYQVFSSRPATVFNEPMYIPAAFRETRLEVLHALIREHSFATLISEVNGQLFATHMPFLLDSTRGANGTLRGHMARANPHWQSFSEGQAALVIFQGPHAYISPSWYLSEPAVPTWNYSAVHAYGTPMLLSEWKDVRTLLEDTVNTFESAFAEQWSTARAGEDYIARLGQAIVAF